MSGVLVVVYFVKGFLDVIGDVFIGVLDDDLEVVVKFVFNCVILEECRDYVNFFFWEVCLF